MPGGESTTSVREPSRLEARDNRGRTVLIVAATDKDSTYLSSLIELGSNVNAQDYDGETALMAAVKCGNIDSMIILLDKGEAKTHYQDSSGSTALHLAVQYGSLEIIRLIVSSWADINITNNRGQKPIDVVNSDRDEIRYYLSHSPVEKAGSLLKALAKEFQSLIAVSEEFLQRNISIPHNYLSSSGASSTPSSRRMRVSPRSPVNVSSICSISDRATHTTLSALVFRFLDLRITLQHRVSELASDYGDRDPNQAVQSNAHLNGSNKYQERVHPRGNDVHGRRTAPSNNMGDKLAEVQWCLEALNETCRIFCIIFPASMPLTDLRKWAIQIEINKHGTLSGSNWATYPIKGPEEGSVSMKKDERSAFRNKRQNSKKITSSVPDARFKSAPLLFELLHQNSFNTDMETLQPISSLSISPALSIQNLMFTQVPGLYEQHLATLNKKDANVRLIPPVRSRRCIIC